MASLTVTSRGQLTLRKDLLKHLGVQGGGKVECEMAPGGCITLKPKVKTGSIEDVFGMLAGKSKVKLTIEEINKAIEEAGAAAGMAGLKR
jgi:bifunctional DNA-binding transcriptional regulator/antitoxin component of YhaV-PrlF toxin-antitoxin module